MYEVGDACNTKDRYEFVAAQETTNHLENDRPFGNGVVSAHLRMECARKTMDSYDECFWSARSRAAYGRDPGDLLGRRDPVRIERRLPGPCNDLGRSVRAVGQTSTELFVCVDGPSGEPPPVARLRWWASGPTGGPVAVTGIDVARIERQLIQSLHVVLDA